MKHTITLSPSALNVEIRFPYNFDEKEYVKRTLRARYVDAGDDKYWTLPVGEASYMDLREYATQFGSALAGEVVDCLVRQTYIDEPYAETEIDGVASSNQIDGVASSNQIDIPNFKIDLYPFQKAGVAFAVEKQKCIIGDDMGLGKTYQALGALGALEALDSFIVVCPASVKVNWARSVRAAYDDVSISIWDSKTGDAANCIIINYDNLKKRLNKLLGTLPQAIIFDEGHYLKNAKAQRTIAAADLAKMVDVVMLLTGTPIMNRPSELIAPLQIIDQFDQFGSWFDFVFRYCEAHRQTVWTKKGGVARQIQIWDTTGAANLPELHNRLTQSCMIRRKKSEVLKDLPAKRRVQQVFDIDNRHEYEDARDNFLEYVKACAADDEAFLATIQYMTATEQIYAIREHQAEEAWRAERAQQLVMIETLKQIATRGKLKAVEEWIEDFLETGEKLAIFTTHTSAQEQLLHKFRGSARILSIDDAYQRQQNIDRFKSDPNCNLMIASMKAGGTGVDGLQGSCSNAAFLELGWTPAEHLQAEDRFHRIGQEEAVTIYYLVAEDTLEEDIQEMLARKQAICDSVLDGAPEMKEGSVFNDLIQTMRDKARKEATLF